MATVLKESAFESMKLVELRQYLKSNGQLMSGNKSELVRRAKGTFKILLRKSAGKDVSVSSVSVTESQHVEAQPQVALAVLRDSSVLAENDVVKKLTDWVKVDDVERKIWPDVTDKELYNYLVYSCNKTVDLMERGARRQLKAHTFYEDRHVHSICYHPILESSPECYIKCLVIPSFASSNRTAYPDRVVWLRMSKITGRVIAAYCTCTAGLEGSCNHVAALLYALVDITAHKHKGLDSASSNTCKWNVPRKRRLSPKKASSMVPEKKQSLEEIPVSAIDQARFAEKLKVCAPSAGWLVNISASSEKKSEKLISMLPDAQFMFSDSTDLTSDQCKAAFVDYMSHLTCKEDERWMTECVTCKQYKSSLWHSARAGRLTASHFGEVCKRRKTTRPESLVKSVLNYHSEFSNKHTKWGLSHEPAAKRMYMQQMKKSHPHIIVEPCGLIIDKVKPFLASSPDGIVKCTHCQPSQGLLEVKCPSVYRHRTPEDACSDKNFFCENIQGSVSLKQNHNYYYQVQGQLGTSGRKWCDFLVWTLKGMSVERIMFDAAFWQSMVEKLSLFYANAVVPELFTHRIKRGKSLY